MPFMFRTSQVVNLSSVESNINLYTKAGSPKDARNVYLINSANKTATGTNPAVTLGTPWKGGSDVVLINQTGVSITGATGATGNPGNTGTTGNPGTAGNTGTTGNPGTAGNPGNTGNSGSSGAGGAGGYGQRLFFAGSPGYYASPGSGG